MLCTEGQPSSMDRRRFFSQGFRLFSYQSPTESPAGHCGSPSDPPSGCPRSDPPPASPQPRGP
eukprot:15066008-Alexandrium_andersonii.AAC.1